MSRRQDSNPDFNEKDPDLLLFVAEKSNSCFPLPLPGRNRCHCGDIPLSRSLLRLSNSMATSSTTEKVISRVATASMLGLIC